MFLTALLFPLTRARLPLVWARSDPRDAFAKQIDSGEEDPDCGGGTGAGEEEEEDSDEELLAGLDADPEARQESYNAHEGSKFGKQG